MCTRCVVLVTFSVLPVLAACSVADRAKTASAGGTKTAAPGPGTSAPGAPGRAAGPGERGLLTRSYRVTVPLSDLVVDSRAGAVKVTGTQSGQVRVTEQIHTHGRVSGVGHDVRGGRLELRNRCGHRCWVDYTVQVPRQLHVDVVTHAGAVQVAGMTGDLHVQSQAGDVTATGLRAAHITARSSAGDVAVDCAAAPTDLDAETEAGDVTVRVPRLAGGYAVDAQVAVGVRTVAVPIGTGGHRIRARSTAGQVSVLPAR